MVTFEEALASALKFKKCINFCIEYTDYYKFSNTNNPKDISLYVDIDSGEVDDVLPSRYDRCQETVTYHSIKGKKITPIGGIMDAGWQEELDEVMRNPDESCTADFPGTSTTEDSGSPEIEREYDFGMWISDLMNGYKKEMFQNGNKMITLNEKRHFEPPYKAREAEEKHVTDTDREEGAEYLKD